MQRQSGCGQLCLALSTPQLESNGGNVKTSAVVSWIVEGLGLVAFFVAFGLLVDGLQEGNRLETALSALVMAVLLGIGLFTWWRERKRRAAGTAS